jgi:hypothetical protein
MKYPTPLAQLEKSWNTHPVQPDSQQAAGNSGKCNSILIDHERETQP